MTTELLNEPETTAEVTVAGDDIRTELEQLLRFKQEHVPKEGQTPCAACATLVDVRVNQCPYCESNIAASNALVRESLRRLEEINAQLDHEHADHPDLHRPPAKPTFGQRLKRLFTSSNQDMNTESVVANPDGPRFLDRVPEGDHLIVLEHRGPWCRVKTRDSRIGWIYSTFVEERD